MYYYNAYSLNHVSTFHSRVLELHLDFNLPQRIWVSVWQTVCSSTVFVSPTISCFEWQRGGEGAARRSETIRIPVGADRLQSSATPAATAHLRQTFRVK